MARRTTSTRMFRLPYFFYPAVMPSVLEQCSFFPNRSNSQVASQCQDPFFWSCRSERPRSRRPASMHPSSHWRELSGSVARYNMQVWTKLPWEASCRPSGPDSQRISLGLTIPSSTPLIQGRHVIYHDTTRIVFASLHHLRMLLSSCCLNVGDLMALHAHAEPCILRL